MAVLYPSSFICTINRPLDEKMNVASEFERDQIPVSQRYRGMIVTVRNSGETLPQVYWLPSDDLTNDGWEAFAAGKVDIDQGAGNSGKILGVGADGIITPIKQFDMEFGEWYPDVGGMAPYEKTILHSKGLYMRMGRQVTVWGYVKFRQTKSFYIYNMVNLPFESYYEDTWWDDGVDLVIEYPATIGMFPMGSATTEHFVTAAVFGSQVDFRYLSASGSHPVVPAGTYDVSITATYPILEEPLV
jgi:hypothetical protein